MGSEAIHYSHIEQEIMLVLHGRPMWHSEQTHGHYALLKIIQGFNVIRQRCEETIPFWSHLKEIGVLFRVNFWVGHLDALWKIFPCLYRFHVDFILQVVPVRYRVLVPNEHLYKILWVVTLIFFLMYLCLFCSRKGNVLFFIVSQRWVNSCWRWRRATEGQIYIQQFLLPASCFLPSKLCDSKPMYLS